MSMKSSQSFRKICLGNFTIYLKFEYQTFVGQWLILVGSGFYCKNCLGEANSNEELIKLSIESQVIFRSIERKNYAAISQLNLDNISTKSLSEILKKSISNVLGVQLKTSRFL